MLIWADGFDHYGDNGTLSQQGIYSGFTQDVSGAYSRTGPGCAFAYTFDPPSDFNFPVAIAAGCIGFAFYCDGLGGDNRRYFYGSGGVQFQWHVNGNGSVDISDNAANVFSSNPGVINNQSWTFIEFAWVMGNPGTLTFRVNNAVLFTSNNVNLGGSPTLNLMRTRTAGSGFRIDDLYLLDNSGASNNGPLGDIRCRTLFPNTDGALQQWPVTGDATAHEAMAHVPGNVAAHYVAGQNVGDAVEVGIDDLPVNTAYVFGTVLVNQLSKTDAGACTVVPTLESGAGHTDGAAFNPGVGNAYVQNVIEHDPNGGGPWTKAAVNASLIKLTRTA